MDVPFSEGDGRLGGEGNDRGTGGPPEGPSVLVVERNRSIRQLMWRALRTTYEAQMAVTYEELRRHAREQTHDAVVMSLYPFDVGEARKLVEDLRASARYADCAIIAVCHPSVEVDAEQLRTEGVDEVLRMPFGASDLLSVLDRHLG